MQGDCGQHKRIRWRAGTAVGLLIGTLLLAGCGAQAEPPKVHEVPGGDADRGRQALVEYGCTACHTVPGVTGANATVGPPLAAWARRTTSAAEFPNQPDYLVGWIANPQGMKPGTIMPNTGITEADARDVGAYLYTLDVNTARFGW